MPILPRSFGLIVVVRCLIFLSCGLLAVPPVECACHASEHPPTPAESDFSPPHDDDHGPGCIAITCDDRAPVNLTPSTTVASDVSWTSLVLPAPRLPIDVERITVNDSGLPHPSDPPLYLSHCALVR